jgi:hypothetical protein
LIWGGLTVNFPSIELNKEEKMKSIKWLALALACGLAVPAAMGAALVTKGSNKLNIGGSLDFDTEDGAVSQLAIQYGYFFWDRISLGAEVIGSDDGIVKTGSIGVLGEYNFALPAKWKPLFGTDLVPFLGVGVDYRHAELYDEHQNAAVFSAETGLKFFLTDSTAINLSLVGEYATEDIYSEYPEGTDVNLFLQLSMGLYF